jgi:hypothetical protein
VNNEDTRWLCWLLMQNVVVHCKVIDPKMVLKFMDLL